MIPKPLRRTIWCTPATTPASGGATARHPRHKLDGTQRHARLESPARRGAAPARRTRLSRARTGRKGGGTTTLTRLDPRVSIKSYDAQGNEVYANSTNLAYEIWTVNFNLPAGNYVVRAKYGRNTWSEGLAVNVVISAKPATAVSVTEVNASADSVAVTVNGTAKKVKITYASGATRTFNRDDANVSIASNGDGEIWTINVKLTEGDYTATAKYIDNGKQVWDTTDFAFTV